MFFEADPNGSALVDEQPRININQPRWDQRKYWGRVRHFMITTLPTNLLKSDVELDKAQEVVLKYRRGEKLPGMTVDELWRAKHTYDSAFHPETGEKQMLIGRMSAQVPCNMVISGCMLTWYRSNVAAFFWQWINQSFNALVNYTNRSGKSPITNEQLAASYFLATSGAVGTAIGLNKLVRFMPPLIGRWVPFAAIAAANCVNIPMMRRKCVFMFSYPDELAADTHRIPLFLLDVFREITEGIPVLDDHSGNPVAVSQEAAKRGISHVVVSRIATAAPHFVLLPILMNHLDKRGFLRRNPWSALPIQLAGVGFLRSFATPLCTAFFPQISSIEVSRLEPEVQEVIRKLENPPEIVYYNKGL
ncbi:unnamed protein product [Notodromas monacha]|uniref:Sidoreflexin n=1 Tax=Notodromas monacha TaxID=399045 RepID=A0A7R9BG24_9CRUS|nr:unnamed protein product [Notodromas monacha]CAG0914801.1 unnamed protein product [Notodromas monacha]